MKNLLLTIVSIIFLFGTNNAQEFGFKKGSKFLEGNVKINYSDDENWGENSRMTIIVPKFGYFVNDKLAIGVDLMFSDMHEEKTDENTSFEMHGFGFGVFGRYYFLELGSRFKTYAELTADYGNTYTNEIENGVVNRSPDYISYYTSANLGANFFVTKRLSINYTLTDLIYARTSKNDIANSLRDNEFTLNLNIFNNIFSESSFGLSYRF